LICEPFLLYLVLFLRQFFQASQQELVESANLLENFEKHNSISTICFLEQEKTVCLKDKGLSAIYSNLSQ